MAPLNVELLVEVWIALCLLAVGALTVSGCFDYKYEEAEIQDVVRGSVPSPSDRYRIPRPEIPVARKNIGIVREGGLFVIVVSSDLRSTLRKYVGGDVEFGVHFKREPRRHLVLERVWKSGQEFEVCDPEEFRYRLPDLVSASDISMEAYDQEIGLCEVPPEDEAVLSQVANRPIFASSFHVRKDKIPTELVEHELVVASGKRTDKKQYFITSEGADYLIVSRDPTTYLMLDYLRYEDRQFQGGIRVAGVFDLESRVATRVAGVANIEWVALGGPTYFRAQ